MTAPSVFHVGVKERVSVQLDPALFNSPVTLYLEHETSRELMSNKFQVTFESGDEGKTRHAELEVQPNKFNTHSSEQYSTGNRY